MGCGISDCTDITLTFLNDIYDDVNGRRTHAGLAAIPSPSTADCEALSTSHITTLRTALEECYPYYRDSSTGNCFVSVAAMLTAAFGSSSWGSIPAACSDPSLIPPLWDELCDVIAILIVLCSTTTQPPTTTEEPVCYCEYTWQSEYDCSTSTFSSPSQISKRCATDASSTGWTYISSYWDGSTIKCIYRRTTVEGVCTCGSTCADSTSPPTAPTDSSACPCPPDCVIDCCDPDWPGNTVHKAEVGNGCCVEYCSCGKFVFDGFEGSFAFLNDCWVFLPASFDAMYDVDDCDDDTWALSWTGIVTKQDGSGCVQIYFRVTFDEDCDECDDEQDASIVELTLTYWSSGTQTGDCDCTPSGDPSDVLILRFNTHDWETGTLCTGGNASNPGPYPGTTTLPPNYGDATVSVETACDDCTGYQPCICCDGVGNEEVQDCEDSPYLCATEPVLDPDTFELEHYCCICACKCWEITLSGFTAGNNPELTFLNGQTFCVLVDIDVASPLLTGFDADVDILGGCYICGNNKVYDIQFVLTCTGCIDPDDCSFQVSSTVSGPLTITEYDHVCDCCVNLSKVGGSWIDFGSMGFSRSGNVTGSSNTCGDLCDYQWSADFAFNSDTVTVTFNPECGCPAIAMSGCASTPAP